jgi:hypothetical protein
MTWILKYQFEEGGTVYHKQTQTSQYPNSRQDAKKVLFSQIPEHIMFNKTFNSISLEAAE